MVHQSAAKKRIIFGLTIFLEILFAERQKKNNSMQPPVKFGVSIIVIKEIEISWYIILILIIIGVFLFCAYRLSQQRYYQKLKILKKYKSAYLKYPQRK